MDVLCWIAGNATGLSAALNFAGERLPQPLVLARALIIVTRTEEAG